jgi:acyl carrier protein
MLPLVPVSSDVSSISFLLAFNYETGKIILPDVRRMSMAPTEHQIRAAVERVLREFLNGREAEITDDTSPIDDLDLDSELGINLADIMEDELGVKVPAKVNPFKKSRNATRTVREIVQLLVSLSEEKVARHA